MLYAVLTLGRTLPLQWTNHLHHPPAHVRWHSQPNADAMAPLLQNLESTKQFLVHLLCLDADCPVPLAIKTLAGDIITQLNEMARDCIEQVRKLLKYEREFQRIVAEGQRSRRAC